MLERYGRCDVFVHCAAAFDQVTISDVDAATWRHVQAVNVESGIVAHPGVHPGMAERRFGRIVFITSDTFWAPPTPALLAYIASKGALLGVMRTLAVTLGPAGIAVSAVAPGLTDTPASRVVNTDQQFDATVDRQALKRRLTPDDTAAAVAYLASDAAAAMTGQVLCADGGLVVGSSAQFHLHSAKACDAGLAAAAPGGYDVIVDFLWGGLGRGARESVPVAS